MKNLIMIYLILSISVLSAYSQEVISVIDNKTGKEYSLFVPPPTNENLKNWDETLVDPTDLLKLQNLILSGKVKIKKIEREPGWRTFYEGHIENFRDGKTLKIFFFRATMDEKDKKIVKTQFTITDNGGTIPIFSVTVDKNGKYLHCENCPVSSNEYNYNIPQQAAEYVINQ